MAGGCYSGGDDGANMEGKGKDVEWDVTTLLGEGRPGSFACVAICILVAIYGGGGSRGLLSSIASCIGLLLEAILL